MSAAIMMMVAHVALCLLLIAGVFWRAVKMDDDVRAGIRFAFVALGTASLFALGAPVALGWQPDAVSLSMMAAMSLVQHVTARHWRGGVPVWYYKQGSLPAEKIEVAAPPRKG